MLMLFTRIIDWLWYIFCRIFQAGMYIVARCFNWNPPETIEGAGSFLEIPSILKKKGFKKPMIVTDKFLTKLGRDSKKSKNRNL